MLTSCAETKYKIEYVVIKPSADFLEECKPIQKKEIKTNGDLLIAYNNLIFDYTICSNKIVVLKKFYQSYEQEREH